MRTVLTRRHHPLAINQEELVMVAVMGQIANPVASLNPYRIGHDGIPRLLPATGGIVLNQRIGDRCVGLAGDHIEPGVSLHNNASEVIGLRQGPNLALLTYACVGNRVSVVSGPATGQWGFVTGKHGGVYHVLVDFPPVVLRQLHIGDRMQVASVGLGLRLLDYPAISVFNSSPALLRAWGLRPAGRYLEVPVTHRVPASLMGSGLGQNTIWRGDYDIQLFDAAMRRRYRLDSLRFGDLVAILHTDVRFGPAYRQGYVTIGVIAHGDSTVSGHGPGVTPLLTGPMAQLRPRLVPQANLAVIFGVRVLPPARSYAPLVGRRTAALVPRHMASHRRAWGTD